MQHRGARDRLVSQMMEHIRRRRWQAGEPIPTERDLATLYRVARVTVRSVLAEFEAKGLIHRRGRVRVAGTAVGQSGTADRPVLVLAVNADDARSHHLVSSGCSVSMNAGAILALQSGGLPYHLVTSQQVKGGHADLRLLNPRGAILATGSEGNPDVVHLVNDIRALGIPVVGLGPADGLTLDDIIDSHHELGGNLLAATAASAGCECAVLRPNIPVGNATSWWTSRLQGIAMAVQAAQANLSVHDVPYSNFGDHSAFAVDRAVREMLGWLVPYLRAERRPHVIMAANDMMGLAVAEAVRLWGLDPERDIAILGYDHHLDERVANLSQWRPAATIDKQNGVVGARAVTCLIERIHGFAGPPRHILVPPLLLRRT